MKDKTQEVRKLMDIVNEGITINEATKIEKMDFSEYESQYKEMVNVLKREGFNGTFNPTTREWNMQLDGIQFTIELGGENVYLRFSDRALRTKPEFGKWAKGLKTFLKMISNYG